MIKSESDSEPAQMARRYLLQPLRQSEAYRLPRDLGHHLCSVMKVRVGELIRLFDGAGLEADAEVIVCQRDQIEVCIGPAQQVERAPALELSVAFAMPRRARCDWLFEHGCEVGIQHFFPLVMARSRPINPSGRCNQTGRSERWQRILEAAAGQCDRSQLPQLHRVRTLAELLCRADLPATRYFAHAVAPPLTPSTQAKALLVVGPEGGLMETERENLLAADFLPRSLGPLTLRTETAALVGAARLLQE